MRRKVTLFVALVLFSFMLIGCDNNDAAEIQRDQSVSQRADMFARAEAKYPEPYTQNFPLRGVLAEYTRRQDLLNHPWYTYILSDTGQITHYFVSTTVPVNSCAFMSSTEDVREDNYGNLVLTAPSLDGIYYGGAGASSACNGWIFIDAATNALGMAFGTKLVVFDVPLILETEPILLQPVATPQ